MTHDHIVIFAGSNAIVVLGHHQSMEILIELWNY